MRLIWIFVALAVLVLIPFVIWGDQFETFFTSEGFRAWLEGFGHWAWLVGIGLLVADLFLPVLNTAVMSGLGWMYGVLLGGALSVVGSMLSGLLAYGLCRSLGRGPAVWIAGEMDLAKGEALFRERGGWLVALSRWLPILPEVVACAAGLTRMPFQTFVVSMVCGCVPLGFTFAAIGYFGRDQPVVALLVSVFLPPVLWVILRPRVKSGPDMAGSRSD